MQTSSAVNPQLIRAFCFCFIDRTISSGYLLWLVLDLVGNPEVRFLMTRSNKVSRVVRKPDFCICENKDADQLCGNREADQRLCFRYTDSTIPLLPKYEISSLQPSSVVVQPGLCGTWSETPKTGFLRTRLK